MRKLIDLDGATFKALSIKAIEAGTNLKSYIELVLTQHAGGQKIIKNKKAKNGI